jgi:hypothetical protein
MSRNQDFVRGLFDKAETQRRETQRQNIITAFNMAGASISQMLMNPKFLVKTGYLLFLGFTAFHVTRFGVALFTSLLLARFGKPTLVRETSKLHTHNYLAIPYIYGKKFIS